MLPILYYKRKKFHLFREFFPKLPTIFFYLLLKRKLRNCKTILDLGCGDLSPIRFVDAETFGVDANESAIKEAKKNLTHNQYIIINIKKLEKKFKPKSFDAVVALDVIEHMKKDGGMQIIKNMEKIARKKVVIFTPNGFMPQVGKSIYDSHLSGWAAEEMSKNGYKVFGIYGPKVLRGEFHKIRYKPEFFWAIISELMQWSLIYNNPQNATAILCIKETKN